MEAEGIHFPLERGVKQGDPTSPRLFTCVLENIQETKVGEKNA
jgi:hypothetical protein